MKPLVNVIALVILLFQQIVPYATALVSPVSINRTSQSEMQSPIREIAASESLAKADERDSASLLLDRVPQQIELVEEESGLFAAAEDQYPPTATLSAEEITVTPTETAPASETPVTSATPSATSLPAKVVATATPEPRPVEEIEPAADLPYEIILKSDPEFITPGGQATIQWKLAADIAGYDAIVFYLSRGVVIKEFGKESLYDAQTNTLQVPYAPQGAFEATIEIDAELPVYVDARLSQNLLDKSNGTAPDSREFSAFVEESQDVHWGALPLLEKKSVSKAGGQVTGLGNMVKVEFPADALLDAAEVFIHRPLRESMPPSSLSGQPFEITARDVASKQEQRKFKEFVEIEVSYSDYDVSTLVEGDLYLHWYDPELDTWRALPTVVDKEKKVIRGVSNHFTVFDIGVNNWQASHLPTVDAFQVSNFTGAATYSYPIEVPPGPGGLQPSLSLNYNSQIVDQSISKTQASWVGMGWSLEAGSIERINNGTPSHLGDDTFMLNVGGVSSRIVWSNAESQYRLTDENFWKIQRNGDASWIVWDKTGNVYYFEKVVYMQYNLDGGNDEICGKYDLPYKWMLTQSKNIYGQVLSYAYSDEQKDFQTWVWKKNTKGIYVCSAHGPFVPSTTATYLSSIKYPHNRYQIRFVREARWDYPAEWVTDAAYREFQRSRLKEIIVEQDSNDDGVFETVIRKYELEYEANPDNIVWPGVSWTAGGKTTTLKKITQYGINGTTALPAQIFTYGDNMHLTKANNGYGGSITFNYNIWYSEFSPNSHSKYQYFGPSRRECGLFGWTVEYGYLGCQENTLAADRMTVWGTVKEMNLDKDLIRPGGAYIAVAHGNVDAGTTLNIGHYNGFAEYYGANGAVQVLSPSASRVVPKIKVTGAGYGYFYQFEFRLLTSVYLVTSKVINDGRNHDYAYSYQYAGTRLNSAATAEWVTFPNGNTTLNICESYPNPFVPPEWPCPAYIETFAEFRGNDTVIETDPTGLKTTTNYHQTDSLKGRPSKVTITDVTGRKYSEILYSYQATPLNMYHPNVEGCNVGDCFYKGLSRNWIYISAEERRIYSSNSSYSAVREEYQYDAYGNQIITQSQVWNGAGWSDHIRAETDYFPNVNGVYLVGLPGRSRQLDANGTVLGSSLFLYDGNQASYATPPSAGKLTSVRTRVEGGFWSQVSYIYDGWGNRTEETTWSGYGAADTSPTTGNRVTTTQYDPIYHTYPLSITNPLGQTTSWTYNYSRSVPASETDPNGAVTSAEYDLFGRLVKLIRPGDTASTPTIAIEYSPNVPFTTTIRQRLDGDRYYGVRRTYDGMGRQYKQETGKGKAAGVFSVFSIVDTLFDSLVQTRQSAPYAPGENPAYATTTLNYGAGKKITTVTRPDGAQTKTTVDGLVTTVIDPAGRVTTSQADVWGRTISVVPPEGPSVSYTYDLLGRLLTATRAPAGSTTTAATVLTYDMAGRKTAMSDPDMGEWTYAYDALGNLTQQTDARGCILNLSYDLLNRLTGKNSSGNCGEQISTIYTYDAGANGKGRRTGMSDASGSSAWGYDARGRMTSETKTIAGQPYPTQWTYNSADLPLTMTYPDGEVVTNSYDDRMLLDRVNGISDYVQSAEYDSSGRLIERVLGNGLAQNYDYYAWNQQGGRLQSLETTGLQSLAYQYDPLGNITQIEDAINSETQTYAYDALDRLTGWTLNGTLQETYTYNPVTGNLASKGGATLAYNDPYHIHAATSLSDQSSVSSYQYDANGNQVARDIADDGQYQLLYDAENRLVEVKKDNTPIAQFTYDGDGKRVKSVIDGETTLFVGAHYEVQAANPQPPVNVAVPVSSFDTNTTWQTQQTSPTTWLWRSNWWGAHTGTTNYLITNNAYGNLTSKPIPVTPNTQYVLSGWVRGELNDQQGEAGWIIRAAYYTSADQYISYTDVASGIAASISTTWAQKSGTATTPANAAYVRVVLFNYLSSGWVAFDDISFKKNGTGVELVEDPGFELGTGWTTTQTSPGTWLWRATWLGNRTGAYGYVITNNVYGNLTSGRITVTPNTQYTLSGWVRGELDDSQGEGGWVIRAAYYTSADQYISYTDVASGTVASTSTTWSQRSGTATTPANAAFVRVFLYNHLSSGWVTFDDISFKKNGTGVELVEDPGFELGTGWTITQTSPGTWLWRGNWAESGGRNGSYGYAITNTVYGDLSSKLIPVTPGSQYDISTWIRGEIKGYHGVGGFILRVEVYGSNGQYMSYTDLASSYQGVVLTPAWQQLLRQYTAPAGAAHIRVRVFNHRASGWAAFDDLSVRKSGSATELLSNPGFESVNNTPINTSSISASQPVSPAASYNITARVRGQKTDANAAWRIRAVFFDENEQEVGSHDIASQATHALSLESQTVNAWVTPPAWAASVKIELRANFATGWVSFDEIVLLQAAEAATKYYFAGTQRIAMRTCWETACSDPTFLLADHLGSTSLTTDAEGNVTSEMRYNPWGEVRYTSSLMPTDYTFTDQYSYTGAFGLMFYNARWYDPAIGRFAQADSIVPLQSQGVQAWDRYAYVNNNPVRYSDPSGHCAMICTAIIGASVSATFNYSTQVYTNLKSGMDFKTAATSIDGTQLLIAAAGGAVAGATMGLVNPALTAAIGSIPGSAVSGAIANVVAGQYEAALSSGINQVEDLKSGKQFDSDVFYQDASDLGLGQADVMIFDAAVGAFVAGATQGAMNYISPPLHPKVAMTPSREALMASQGYVVGSSAAIARRIADYTGEAVIRTLRRISDPILLSQ